MEAECDGRLERSLDLRAVGLTAREAKRTLALTETG